MKMLSGKSRELHLQILVDTLVLDTVVQLCSESYAVQMIDYSVCMMVGDQAQESREGDT